MNGVVQSGGTTVKPIPNVRVTLYKAYAGSSMMVAQTSTDSHGAFSVPNASFKSDSFFYVTADLNDGVLFMATLGPTVPVSIVINELTTVAATYSAAQFLVNASIQGDSFSLGVVAGMNANLVDVVTGASSTVMTTSPNADETSSCRTTLSLANALAACVGDRDKALQLLFRAATPPGGSAPTDTITALGNIARNPANQAGAIYVLSRSSNAYDNALRDQPVAWTVAVKVNDSGCDEYLFGGPANFAFDAQGRAWIPNNVIQGTGNSSPYSMVLDSTGRPATDATGKRISPFTGGGLLGAGFGVDVDRNGCVWIGDFGWGGTEYFPPGSFSQFGSDASAMSPSEGWGVNVIERVQGTVVDPSGNVWVAGWGNGVVACYPDGNGQATPATYAGDAGSFQPFGIAIAKDGSAWVTNSNSEASTVVNLRYDGTSQLQLLRETTIGKTAKGIAIDKSENIWIGSGGDDHVYLLDSIGTVIGGFQGGGTYGPWGIALDGADNLWVANFGPLEVGSVFHGRLTCLAGVNATGHRLGDALTPPTGYTLPTAGSPVLLHNGQPLYGGDLPPCYIPMMRTTGVNIDAGGNVWTCNNWKPSFDNDLFGDPFTGAPANPGGDGILIWVGLAKPKLP